MDLRSVSAESLSAHHTADSCWVAIDGKVYDVSAFLDAHPGGRRLLLAQGGRDATEAFHRHHAAGVLEEHGASLLLGNLEGAAEQRRCDHFGGEALASPFPHQRHEGSGLEAVRFHWAKLDALTTPPDAAAPSCTVFLQRSQVSSLDEANWLHEHQGNTYASEMAVRRTLLLEHSELVDTSAHGASEGETLAAEMEFLEMILDWVQRFCPGRFEVSAEAVRTLTPGYEHTFKRHDYRKCPLRLAALMIQEDLLLLREEDLSEGEVVDFDQARPMSQPEDHPSGKRHVLVSGISCFSTNVIKRHKLPMSGIHHPAVPGFHAHLQQAVNLFLAQLSHEGYWRHNYMFQDFDSVVLLDHPWAQHVCQAELKERVHHKAADRAARFDALAGEGFFKGIASAADVQERIRLRCEYQTLRRLRRNSRFIVFTIKTYVDPMEALAEAPSAALALSAAMRLKPKGVFHYQGMGLPKAQRAVLGFLDGIVQAGGLRPWTGIVPEPWERQAEEDGTFAFEADRKVREALLRERRCFSLQVAVALGVCAALMLAAGRKS